LPQIDVDLQDDSSSTTYQILDQISESNLNDHDHGMDDPEIRPKWAQKTLQSAGELVGDPTDLRRTRSQFEGAPHVLTATEPLYPLHANMVLAFISLRRNL
jgi:hypothetical protein